MNTKPRNYVQKNLHKFCKPSIIPNKKKHAKNRYKLNEERDL